MYKMRWLSLPQPRNLLPPQLKLLPAAAENYQTMELITVLLAVG